MTSGNTGVKVSRVSRVLAWILLACAALVLVDAIVRMLLGRPLPMRPVEAVMMILGLLIMCPLLLFVALKGRSPRWMTSVENLFDNELRRQGVPESASLGARSRIPLATSLVFGVMLFLFGLQLDLFSGETGWFAMTVFGVAWLIVTALLWRNFRKRSLKP